MLDFFLVFFFIFAKCTSYRDIDIDFSGCVINIGFTPPTYWVQCFLTLCYTAGVWTSNRTHPHVFRTFYHLFLLSKIKLRSTLRFFLLCRNPKGLVTAPQSLFPRNNLQAQQKLISEFLHLSLFISHLYKYRLEDMWQQEPLLVAGKHLTKHKTYTIFIFNLALIITFYNREETKYCKII